MAENSLDDNHIYGRIVSGVYTLYAMEGDNKKLFAIAQNGNEGERVRALKIMAVQFSEYPALVTEAKIDAIAKMADADNASPAFKKAATELLDVISSPKREIVRATSTLSQSTYELRQG